MATRNGIEYNLWDSHYICDWGCYRFYFSSATHLAKFKKNIKIRIEWLDDSLSRRFRFDVIVPSLAVFQLYRQVETRGFLIFNADKGEWYDCPENITFHGMRISARS